MKMNEKSTLVWLRIIAITVIGIFIVTLFTAINFHKEFVNASVALHDMDTVTTQLSSVSEQLAGIDWGELAENVNNTAQTAQESMLAAAKAIDELDISTLNEAIADLNAIVKPLLILANKFR